MNKILLIFNLLLVFLNCCYASQIEDHTSYQHFKQNYYDEKSGIRGPYAYLRWRLGQGADSKEIEKLLLQGTNGFHPSQPSARNLPTKKESIIVKDIIRTLFVTNPFWKIDNTVINQEAENNKNCLMTRLDELRKSTSQEILKNLTNNRYTYLHAVVGKNWSWKFDLHKLGAKACNYLVSDGLKSHSWVQKNPLILLMINKYRRDDLFLKAKKEQQALEIVEFWKNFGKGFSSTVQDNIAQTTTSLNFVIDGLKNAWENSIFNKKFGRSQRTLNDIFPEEIDNPFWNDNRLNEIEEILKMAEPEDFENIYEYLRLFQQDEALPRIIILKQLWVLGRTLKSNDLAGKRPLAFYDLFASITNPAFRNLKFNSFEISKLSKQETTSLLKLLEIANAGDLKILVNLLDWYLYNTSSLDLFRALTVPIFKHIMKENAQIIDALIHYNLNLNDYQDFTEKRKNPINQNNLNSIQETIAQFIQIFNAYIKDKDTKLIEENLRKQGYNKNLNLGSNLNLPELCNNILGQVGDFYPFLRGIRNRCHNNNNTLSVKEVQSNFSVYGQGTVIQKANNLNDILQMTNGMYNAFAILEGFGTESKKNKREEWAKNFLETSEIKAFNGFTTAIYNQDFKYIDSKQLLEALAIFFKAKEFLCSTTMNLINSDRTIGQFSNTSSIKENDTQIFYNHLPLYKHKKTLENFCEKKINPLLILPALDINNIDIIKEQINTLFAQSPVEFHFLLKGAKSAEEIKNILEQFSDTNILKIPTKTWQSLYHNLIVIDNPEDPKQTMVARERVRQMTNALSSYKGEIKLLEKYEDPISTLPIEKRFLFIHQLDQYHITRYPIDILFFLDPPAARESDQDVVVLLRNAGFSFPYASLLSFDFNTQNATQAKFLDKINERITQVNQTRKIANLKPVSEIEKGELLYLLALLTEKTYGGSGGTTSQKRFTEFDRVLSENFISVNDLKEKMEKIVLQHTDNESIMMKDRQLSQEACNFIINKSTCPNVEESIKNLSETLRQNGSPVFLGALRALGEIGRHEIPLGGKQSINGKTLSAHIYFLINTKLKGQDQINAHATLARALYDMLHNPEDFNSNSIRCNIGALERLSRVLQGYTIDNQKFPMVDDDGSCIGYINDLKANLRILFEENIQEVFTKYPESMQGFSDLTIMIPCKQHIKDYSVIGKNAAMVAFLMQTQHLVANNIKNPKDSFVNPLARLAYAELLQKVIDETEKRWNGLVETNKIILSQLGVI